MKKDTLISLYRILDALRHGAAPDRGQVEDCFVVIRDELLLPDTEEIVVHIRGVLEQSQAAADALSRQLIGDSRRMPLAEKRLQRMMASLPDLAPAEAAVAFGRLVEAAHGIHR